MTEHHETPSQVVHRVTYSLQRWGLSPGPNVPGNFTRPPVALIRRCEIAGQMDNDVSNC